MKSVVFYGVLVLMLMFYIATGAEVSLHHIHRGSDGYIAMFMFRNMVMTTCTDYELRFQILYADVLMT